MVEKKFYDQHNTAAQFKYLNSINVPAKIQTQRLKLKSLFSQRMNDVKKLIPTGIKQATKKLLRLKP